MIPAIDIINCTVVRLIQGNYRYETTYSHSPVEVAQMWDSYVVQMIHVVDLDGALHGEVMNLDVVKDIIRKVKARVEFGGGIRDEDTVKQLLDVGVERVIIGTMALNGNFMAKLAKRFGDHVIAAIDARDGIVHTKGWIFKSKKKVTDLVKQLEEIGVKAINYTDISRDGTLVGPNIASIEELLKATKLRVVVSGGVASLNDVKALKKLEGLGLAGMIIGKALYENKVDLAEVMKIIEPRKKGRNSC